MPGRCEFFSSRCRRTISFRVLADHLSDIEITGHDAWSATFISDEGDDFIVFSKKVKEIVLDGRKVCCRRAMGGEEFSFVDEFGVEVADDTFETRGTARNGVVEV